jgi:type VI secretion system protein ImpA
MPDIEEFLQPISDEAPAGYDVRYEVVYDEIRDGRDADPLADPPKVPDFRLVRKTAEEVLKTQCKHLQVAAWLLEAWVDEEGIPGLVAGIELQTRLLEEFWETVFPEIDEGDLEYRVAPLEWLAGKYLGPTIQTVPLTLSGLTVIEFQQSRSVGYEADLDGDYEKTQARNAEIESGKMAPEDFDKAVGESPKAFYKKLMADMAAALAAMDRLEALTDEKFGNLGPSFRPLRGSVDELQRVVKPILEKKLLEDPDPVEVVAVDEVGDLGDASGDGGGVPLDPVSKDDAGRRIAAAAKYLRQADPHDPASYLMVRGFRWGELRKGGGTVEPRMLAAPPTQIRTQLKTLLLDQKWPELLETAEGIMASPFGRGWLDLQRYIFTAVDGLGPDFEVVRGALKGALRSLLIDLPGLVDLTLMDDTSTANRETQVWLREEGLMGPLTDEELEQREGGAAGAPVVGRDVSDRARERVRAGQAEKAIEMLMQAADQESSARGRALRRAEAAAVMVDHGLAPVAMPILRDIMGQVEEHRLEEWEASEAVAVIMATLYRCIDRMDGDESEKEELYLRVCRLDPMQAIHFVKDSEDDEGGEGELEDA